MLGVALKFLCPSVKITKNLLQTLRFGILLLLFAPDLGFLLLNVDQDLSSYLLKEILFVLLQPPDGFIETHDSNKRSLKMVDFEDTAYDCMRIAEGMDEQADKEVDHESEYVRILAKEDHRLLLKYHAVDLIEELAVKQPQHSVSPVSAHLLPQVVKRKFHLGLA